MRNMRNKTDVLNSVVDALLNDDTKVVVETTCCRVFYDNGRPWMTIMTMQPNTPTAFGKIKPKGFGEFSPNARWARSIKIGHISMTEITSNQIWGTKYRICMPDGRDVLLESNFQNKQSPLCVFLAALYKYDGEKSKMFRLLTQMGYDKGYTK